MAVPAQAHPHPDMVEVVQAALSGHCLLHLSLQVVRAQFLAIHKGLWI